MLLNYLLEKDDGNKGTICIALLLVTFSGFSNYVCHSSQNP